MDHREKLLTIVKEKGPLLPSQINKELRTNVLFASAMLSEMVQQKKIKLSAMRVGGSPLYYCEGQETALEQFAERLQGQDKTAFEALKSSRILRDRDQDPHTRVALREIKDFAIPLEVNANGYSDLFWKYYLVQDAEAESLIKDYINKMEQAKASEEQTGQVPAEKQPEPKEVQSTISPPEPELKPPEQPSPEPVPVAAEVQAPESEQVQPEKAVTSVTMTPLEEDEVPEFSYQPAVSFSTEIDTEEKVKIEKKPEPELEPEPAMPEFPEDDEFFQRVRHFFDESGIEIVDFENIRTGTEYDFTIRLPSNVGHLTYYCKAKSKAKLNEGDLSTTFVYGQMKKLPILLVTVGDLTKKAEELLNAEFKNMFVRKIL